MNNVICSRVRQVILKYEVECTFYFVCQKIHLKTLSRWQILNSDPFTLSIQKRYEKHYKTNCTACPVKMAEYWSRSFQAVPNLVK